MSEQDGRPPQEQENGEQEAKARVDEDWKKSVSEERERLREEADQTGKTQQAGTGQYPQPDFRVFTAGLYTQTLIALGEVENPLARKKEQNLPEAQYLIDTINMLKEKTTGNLTAEEEDYLASLLHDLRMRYVTVTEQSPGEQQPADQ